MQPEYELKVMSSHHFVKEGQEPALFILEGISYQRIEPLLEWVPLILVGQPALETVLKWGIKIDVLLQYESLPDLEERIGDQFPLQIISCKKDDMIQTGLQILVQNKNTSVNLISAQNTEIFSRLETFGDQIQVGLYHENEKWSFINSGKFEKWIPLGHKIFLKQQLPDSFKTEGLIQKGEFWETIGSGMVIIRSKSPFWICESL